MRERWKLVLFHAEWISKSRELEYTLSRLSSKFVPPPLFFSIPFSLVDRLASSGILRLI